MNDIFGINAWSGLSALVFFVASFLGLRPISANLNSRFQKTLLSVAFLIYLPQTIRGRYCPIDPLLGIRAQRARSHELFHDTYTQIHATDSDGAFLSKRHPQGEIERACAMSFSASIAINSLP